MPKAMNVYDGTDSESEDEIIKQAAPAPVSQEEATSFSDSNTRRSSAAIDPAGFKPFRLGYQAELGDLSNELERFCSFQMVKKYPYTYIGNANRDRVDEAFFNRGKIFENKWEFFYLYREKPEEPQQPILLVLSRQFSHFLAKINYSLRTKLTIPAGAGGAFEIKFYNDGSPRPRYLGHAENRDEAEILRRNIPPRYYRPELEPGNVRTPSEAALIAFREKVSLLIQSRPGKKPVNKGKIRQERAHKKQEWNHSIKRVQRYLGFREAKDAHQLISPVSFYSDKPPAFVQESSVIFICVDVEAWERDSSIVTEIGFATLDTKDIASMPPGKRGENWINAIRPRHFRINENKHYINQDFVNGCADRYEFGTSEFIDLKDTPQVIASCFKHPFSKSGETPIDEQPKRNIVMVGHDIISDVNFLKNLGYDIFNLSNLVELVDTALMYRYLRRESNPRNLGSVVADLGIVGWNLHNAGNDAVYTLQAMIAIAIKQLQIREQKRANVSESIKPMNDASLADEGWSSPGNCSDGGLPQVIIPAPTVNTKGKKKSESGKDSGFWRTASEEAESPKKSQNSETTAAKKSPKFW